MNWFYIFALFLFGLPVGSFLNVVIWRLPRKENVVFPPSHCPICNAKIRPYDNIPIISYLILGGKCRDCGAKISPRYPVVELITALLFAVALPLTGWTMSWDLLAALILTGTGIAIAAIDIEHRIIPDELSFGGLIAGVVLAPLRAESFYGLLWGIVGAVSGAVLLFIVRIGGKALFRREAMGWGDVKLIAMIGVFVGWEGVLMTVFIASVIGTIGGIIGMITSQKTRKDREIPFGPYLIAAGIIVFYFGDKILKSYLSLFEF
ncbi:prepilin peptidase [bacterium]|nr:MAG: prepilin peptidase [bacterium]